MYCTNFVPIQHHPRYTTSLLQPLGHAAVAFRPSPAVRSSRHVQHLVNASHLHRRALAVTSLPWTPATVSAELGACLLGDTARETTTTQLLFAILQHHARPHAQQHLVVDLELHDRQVHLLPVSAARPHM